MTDSLTQFSSGYWNMLFIKRQSTFDPVDTGRILKCFSTLIPMHNRARSRQQFSPYTVKRELPLFQKPASKKNINISFLCLGFEPVRWAVLWNILATFYFTFQTFYRRQMNTVLDQFHLRSLVASPLKGSTARSLLVCFFRMPSGPIPFWEFTNFVPTVLMNIQSPNKVCYIRKSYTGVIDSQNLSRLENNLWNQVRSSFIPTQLFLLHSKIDKKRKGLRKQWLAATVIEILQNNQRQTKVKNIPYHQTKVVIIEYHYFLFLDQNPVTKTAELYSAYRLKREYPSPHRGNSDSSLILCHLYMQHKLSNPYC